MNSLDVSRWLGDFYLLATLLLGGEFLACLFAGQPARRIALAWATAGGLLILAILCALPGWSSVHLLSPAPAIPVWAENLPPLAGQAIQESVPMASTIPEGSPMPPPPPRVEPGASILVIDWGVLALYLLATGSAIVIVWLALGAWQVRRLRREAETAAEDILAMLSELTPTGMPVPTVGVLDHLPVAVAVGLRKPAILLPRTLVRDTRADQMRTVLAHELAHLRHRDLWLMAGLRVLMVLLWAHPLFWLWRRRVRLDQEVLADTAAAELTSRTLYAEELVELARYASETRVPRLASSVGLWETRSQLKRRLALLLDEKLTILRSCSRRWWGGSLVVLLSLAGGLSLVTLTPAEREKENNPATKIAENSDNRLAHSSILVDRKLNPELLKQATVPPKSTGSAIEFDTSDSNAWKLVPNTKVTDYDSIPLSGISGPPARLVTEKEVRELNENGINWTPILNTPYTPTFPVDTKGSAPTKKEPTAPSEKIARQFFKKLYDARKPNTITGICIDENGKPLINVNVDVYSAPIRELDSQPKKILSTTTDTTGKYRFEDVIDVNQEFPDGLPGDYFLPDNMKVITVIARKPGRVPGFVGNTNSAAIAKGGEANLHRLLPAQTLRGQVINQQGKPVVGAKVSAGLLPTIRGFPIDVNTALTDENGEYSIIDLESYDAVQAKRELEKRQQGGDLYLSTYAGNDGKPWVRWLWVKHPEYAMKRVEIEKIPGRIDVELQPGAMLSGRVVTQKAGQAPKPAKNVEVRLQRELTPEWESNFSFQSTGTRTDNMGKYRFDSLPAGNYSIVAETSGWVTLGIEKIRIKRGQATQVFDIVMTRGGRVRVQLIDDKTGEPLTFEKPTRGFVNPQPRPRRNNFYFTSTTVEFSPEGIGEQQLSAGNYVFHASVPVSEGQPGWQATTYANIRNPEDLNALPTHKVEEGKVLELTLRMQIEQPEVNGTLIQSSPPSDADKQDEPQKTNEFISATPPADAEGKDAYENGVFVPEPPDKLMEKLEGKIEALDEDDDAYENGIFDDKTPSPF